MQKEKFVEETILRIGGIVKDEYTLNDIIPSIKAKNRVITVTTIKTDK